MAPRSRGVGHVFDVLVKSSTTSAHVCRSCRSTLSRRTYASAATAQRSSETQAFDEDDPASSPATEARVVVKAGVLLSRPPLITPDPHPFETAYHLYQRRLNERLVLPFTQYFYYKRGTPAYEHWRAKRRERGGVAARDLGQYNAYSKEGWNDEVLVGDETAAPEKIVEQLVEEEGRASEFAGEGGDLRLAGLKRVTEADRTNDQRSLERMLSRTLYLLVQVQDQGVGEGRRWRLPNGLVTGKEGLKEAAQRVLDISCGVNMNTWFVGNHPVGHYQPLKKTIESGSPSATKGNAEVDENSVEKTFFMKARIMAGQADVKGNSNNITDYKWLAREEIEKLVNPRYWARIKNMLVEQ